MVEPRRVSDAGADVRRWMAPARAALLLAAVCLWLLAFARPAQAAEPSVEHAAPGAAAPEESKAAAMVKEIFGRTKPAESAAGAVAEIFQKVDLPSASSIRAKETPSRTTQASAAVRRQERTAHDNGTLFLQKPSPGAPATFVGRGSYSADGISNPAGAALRAEMPAGSTPVQAWLYGYFQTGNPSLTERTVGFDGSSVTLSKLDDYNFGLLSSARADVTPEVAAKASPSGGVTTFFAATPLPLDGLGLVVIYSNPSLPEATVAVFDGAAQQTGDVATFTFDAPLNKVPGFTARMSLGIGFSYQQASGHQCGPGSPTSMQYSVVEVNGARLTSCAGGNDDASGFGLLTVGGVGDSLDNPADPLQTPGDGNPVRVQDDELYNLEPFLSQGDKQLVVKTLQPSNDDLLFLSVVQVDAPARVTTEVCGDGLDNDGDGLVDGADPDCPVVVGPTGPVTGPTTPGTVVAPPMPDGLRAPEPKLDAPPKRVVRTVSGGVAAARPRRTLPRTGASGLPALPVAFLLLLAGAGALRIDSIRGERRHSRSQSP